MEAKIFFTKNMSLLKFFLIKMDFVGKKGFPPRVCPVFGLNIIILF